MNNNFTLNEGFNPEGQAKLIIKAFGLAHVKPAFYNVKENANEQEQREVGDENKSLSSFGLPVFDVLDFDTLKYTNDGKIITALELSLGTTLIEVTQTKNIVATAIQGRNGTVKEYISDGDYIINIKGVLVGNGQDVKPSVLKGRLIDFCKAPVEIAVASPLLADFGIYNIVIQSYNFPQMEAQRNTVPFELNCLSDNPIELKSQFLS